MPWTISALLVCATFLFGQSDDMIDRLFLLKEYPRVKELSAVQKADAISKLEALRPITAGKRLQKLSFLLASLGSHYTTNRDYLVGVMRGCSTRQPECDEDTADFLIGLYHGGHRDVLAPLLRAGLHSDGALSELLGPFYGEVLVTGPSDFLAALRQLTAPGQESVCTLAGGADGGGMEPNRFQQAKERLRRAGDRTALQCLGHLEKGNQQAAENNK